MKFTPIRWREAKEGQTVYLIGTYEGEVRHYGPHTVVHPGRRVLVNSRGREFRHYPEDLAVEVTP